jgi:hypothetical protein
MPKSWRWIAPIAVAGGLVASSAVPAAVAQPAQSPVITISATTPLPVITHDVFVVYKDKGYDDATITGSVTDPDATAGEVAVLYAQPFPYKTAPAPVAGQSVAVPASTTPTDYSFADQPTVATKFTVEVLSSSSATTPLATSAVKVVYVVTNQHVSGFKTCARPVCHETGRVDTLLPASAYKAESHKKWYFYFDLKLSRRGEPKPPKYLYLSKIATISKVTRISSTEFKRTISFSFRIGNDGYYWLWTFCSKGTESQDGMNLPGSHSCGAKKIRSSTLYLG